jgi:hypothetical protein
MRVLANVGTLPSKRGPIREAVLHRDAHPPASEPTRQGKTTGVLNGDLGRGLAEFEPTIPN